MKARTIEQRVLQHGQRVTSSAGVQDRDRRLDCLLCVLSEVMRLILVSRQATKIRRLEVVGDLCVGDTSVAMARVLLGDGSELGVGVGLLVEDSTCNRDEILLTVVGIVKESRTPPVATSSSASNEHGSRGQLARKVVKKLIRLECAIKEEARELDDLLIGVSSLEVANQEDMSAGNRDVVLERLEDLFFHVNDL